jgi:hypothetical protein
MSIASYPRILAYWDSDDRTILTEMISAWWGHFPEFRVLSNHDIVPLFEGNIPRRVLIFSTGYASLRQNLISRGLWRCTNLADYASTATMEFAMSTD